MFLSFIFSFFTFTVFISSDNTSYTVSANETYETPYYYYQMSDNAQKAYDELKEAVLNQKKKVTINYSIDNNDFNKIAELLIFHDPMTFNLKAIEAATVKSRSITFKLTYRYTYDSYRKMVSSYEKKIDKILSRLDDDMTTYSKIKIIHDSIANAAVYDIDYKLSDTMYGTLVKGKGKCDGYAKTFAYVCGKAGIRVVTVIGSDIYSSDDSLHMWNKVYYNKQWYNIDVTWDDPVSNMTDNRKYEFFMVSDKEFQKTHTEDNLSFSVPSAKDSSRTYFKVYQKYAKNLSEAKNIIKTEIQKAVKKQKIHITFQCSTDEVYNNVCDYVLDTSKMYNILNNIEKNYNSDLVSEVYSYGFNDVHRTVKIYLFYENTELSDYFLNPNEASEQIVRTLATYGIE